jgi:hypothetical protein
MVAPPDPAVGAGLDVAVAERLGPVLDPPLDRGPEAGLEGRGVA